MGTINEPAPPPAVTHAELLAACRLLLTALEQDTDPDVLGWLRTERRDASLEVIERALNESGA